MKSFAADSDIKKLLGQKSYPCIAAVQAMYRNELIFDTYEGFGTGLHSRRLAENLIQFKKTQASKQIPYLTYMALFPNDTSKCEQTFEENMWKELSAMWDHPSVAGSWDPNFSESPEDQNFCFSLDGSAFFVVGLHSQSSRLSRRLPFNALIFNLYSQFTALMEKGTYEEMVRINRQRDEKFQGSVNPMAEKYNDIWEAIQFSGKENGPQWRCPFTKGLGSSLNYGLQSLNKINQKILQKYL